MDAALQYDYQAPLDAELLELAAEALMVGDTVMESGSIPIRITDVRSGVENFVVAAYESLPGSGHRLYCESQRLSVLRPVAEAGH